MQSTQTRRNGLGLKHKKTNKQNKTNEEERTIEQHNKHNRMNDWALKT